MINLVRTINNELATRHLIEISGASSLVFGASHSVVEFTVRQFLLERLLGASFNKSLLFAIGSRSFLIHPLPAEWRNFVRSQGINVHEYLSALMWYGFLTKQLMRAAFVYIDVMLKCIYFSSLQIYPRHKYAYLSNLSLSNLPILNGSGFNYDICSWYASWAGKSAGVGLIAHGVSATERHTKGLLVKFAPAPYYLLQSKPELVKLSFWFLIASIESTVGLLVGRWWNALFLADAILGRVVKQCPTEVLPNDCLFHYSATVYRPLWTYELEAKGGRIICYFYSTYEQPKLPNKGYVSQYSDWGPATWPHYLVWDKYQEDQLRRNMQINPNITITGPIPFSAGEECRLSIPPKTVAVFDIECQRVSAHFPFSTLGDYFAQNPEVSKLFLEDIQQVLNEYGFTMAFKKKREIGNRGRKNYIKLIDQLSNQSNVIIIPPDVPAMSVVERCRGVISMPFTSTALYERSNNIPSAYYDPTGWIQRDDRASHDIPLLLGVVELRRWVHENLYLKI